MLVVYHGAAGARLRERLDDVARELDVRIVVVDPASESIDPYLDEMTVWWHVLTPITAAHLDAAPNLRLIQKWGVGVNTIDVAAAASRSVVVSNMPGSNAASVAEHATLLTLAVLRQLPTYHCATSSGDGWVLDASVGERSHELAGLTVGLVGYGDIAQRFERILSGFDATVLHHSRRDDRPGWVPLRDLVKRSDVVSLHVPLTPDTERLFDARLIAAMKPGAILINTARGGLVDLDALDAALGRGDLGGAGLDTFDREPWDAIPQVARHSGVVVTPHVAWLTWQTVQRSLDLAVANVGALRDGKEIANVVTPVSS